MKSCFGMSIAAIFLLACTGSLPLHADDLVLKEDVTNTDIMFNVDEGGDAQQDEAGIVFSGQISATDLNVVAKEHNGKLLAAVRMLVESKLSKTPPEAAELAYVQGGVVALEDEEAINPATGQLHGWGVPEPNKGPEWIPLVSGDNPMTLAEDAVVYITMLFNYTDNQYVIYMGKKAEEQIPSQPLAMANAPADHKGFNTVSLAGEGTLKQIGIASGSPKPLSASLGFSVYADARGILFNVETCEEQASGKLRVLALINGEWMEVGSTTTSGTGGNSYRFYAYPGLLQADQAYLFKVEDELGNSHNLDNAIAIKSIKMQNLVMQPDTLQVTFNTEQNQSYQVIAAESVTATEWTPIAVYYPKADGTQGYGTENFRATGDSTTILIPRGAKTRFFKIKKLD